MAGRFGQLSPLDWAMAACYALAVVALGARAVRRKADARDFFLAGRESRWPIVGLSLGASNVSAVALVGLPGAAYGSGISVYDYEWTAVVVLVAFCALVLPAILRARVYTMPQFLAWRYDEFARTYFTILALFLSIVVELSGTLFGGATLFRLIAPGLPFVAIVAGLAVAAAIYAAVGGLRGVLYTEAMQAAVLLAASTVVAALAFQRVGGLHHVLHALAPDKLSLIRPPGDRAMPWPGLLLGVPILGFYYWCTNQFIVQRVLSARSLSDGRWGSLVAGLIKLPGLLLLVLPGSAAVLLYPHLPAPDLVFPTLLFDLLPAGVLGLVLAGFVAAIMSSSAATLNSSATIVAIDIVRRFRPDIGSRGLVRAGRVATVAIMAFAVLWTPEIERIGFGSLFQYLQAVLSYATPPVVALFVGGLLWPGANARGARAAIALGVAAGAILFVLAASALWPLHFLYAAPLIFALTLAGLVVGSRSGNPAAKEMTDLLCWTPALWRAETRELGARPAWQNYRLQSALLLVATAILVYVFR